MKFNTRIENNINGIKKKIDKNSVIIVGDNKVGKTKFIKRINNNEYDNEYNETKNLINIRDIKLNDKEITIYDIFGNENTNNEKIVNKLGIQVLYESKKICKALYDLTNKNTLKSLNKKLMQVRKTNKKIKIILLGNKIEEENIEEEDKIIKQNKIKKIQKNICKE